jgi:hypothetical protein
VVASAAGTMFRQAHDTDNTDDANKKHLRIAESKHNKLTIEINYIYHLWIENMRKRI